MAPITWLASYPKSGNTWLRVFLANYQANREQAFDINRLPYFSHGEMAGGLFQQVAGRPIAELSDEALHRLRPQVHRAIASLDRRPNFVKTHNAVARLRGIATITPEVTLNAIYVVRNPLDVAISYADHYGLTIDEVIAHMNLRSNQTRSSASSVFQYLGRWHEHVQSWTGLPGDRVLTIRYEDMLDRASGTFARVVAHLGWEADRKRLRRAMRFSSFPVLRAQERRGGFYERSDNSDHFFRRGSKDQWRRALSEQQVARIVEQHGEVMRRFDYLP